MPFTHKKDEVRATGTLEARTPGDQAVQVLLYVIIALVALACVLPFIYVVAGSFATERELTERPFFLIPQDVSLNAYQYILKQGDVSVSYTHLDVYKRQLLCWPGDWWRCC